MEYNHERAVADGVNVGFDVYSIQTKITKEGSTVQAKEWIGKLNKMDRTKKWEQLDEDLTYKATQLDRDVVAPSQIRLITKTFRDKLFTELFPNRKEVPKTLVFAKDDNHAEEITDIIREEFGKGNDFCKKITYKTSGEKPEDLLASFRNNYNPRIAVTVDMIATGTDIRPLECILFIRDVKSRTYFEQMLGRGTRVISNTDLLTVTPDAVAKTHFVAVDAVGVFDTIKIDSQPTEHKPTIPLDKLLLSVAMGNRDDEALTSLAGRLARVEKVMKKEDHKEIFDLTKGKSIKTVINDLFNAVNVDKQIEKAKEMFSVEEPDKEHLAKAAEVLAKQACLPFDSPKLRDTIVEIKRKSEILIDEVSIDELQFAGGYEKNKEKAQSLIQSFRKFMEENKDELTALQIIYSKPYSQRHITFEDIKKLADAIRKPPYNLTPDLLWHAFEQLEAAKVKGAGAVKLLTNMVSLMRFAVGQSEVLEPFPDVVERRYQSWLTRQNDLGKGFTPEQEQWLRMIKEHIATSVAIEINDFDSPPFFDRGGRYKAYNLFGDKLEQLLTELNTELV